MKKNGGDNGKNEKMRLAALKAWETRRKNMQVKTVKVIKKNGKEKKERKKQSKSRKANKNQFKGEGRKVNGTKADDEWEKLHRDTLRKMARRDEIRGALYSRSHSEVRAVEVGKTITDVVKVWRDSGGVKLIHV